MSRLRYDPVKTLEEIRFCFLDERGRAGGQRFFIFLIGQGESGWLGHFADDVGECHTMRRKKGRQAGNDDALDAKRRGNAACVLTTSTAKHHKVMTGALEAASLGETTVSDIKDKRLRSDRPAHRLVGYPQETSRNLFGAKFVGFA